MSKPIYKQTQPLPQMLSQGQSALQNSGPLNYARPVTGVVDQVYTENGDVKPEWKYLLNSLSDLGSKNLNERLHKAHQILRDDGATYNIYSDESNVSHPWQLDIVPSVIGSEQWASIESGLLERAELLNLLLKDIYGERSLIKQNVLPAEALFAHKGFLRACQGMHIPGEHQLILHSVDMVQTHSGSMCVLADRTQAPSGTGYVLENRTVMSRVFPSLFRDSHVHRLASFFQRLRHKLIALSPSEQQARVVVLTPGARNENYFEHSYISNYLGFPLVQSSDLVVRNGFVWMKSLEGLNRVDVIFRRIDDIFCDPVELKSDSQFGVPGLLDVVRSGRVVLANPIGSGVLENPVLLKYLPQIGEALLGREPRLSSVKTYWCGDERDLQFVLDNIRGLIIKPIYRGAALSSIWGGDLTGDECTQLLQKISDKPYQFVAQERIDKGHIPALIGHTLEPRPAMLRTFSVAADNTYITMPGGLTRIGSDIGSEFISMREGCPFKDTWVTATEPERIIDNHALEASPNQQESLMVSLPSRVIENLFWLGRYAERAESLLRLLRTVFMLINADEPLSIEARRVLLHAVTQISDNKPGFINASDEQLTNPDDELLLIIKDLGRPGSIFSTLNSLLFCADQSKELLSSDTFRVINAIRDSLDSLNQSLASGLSSAPEEALAPLITPLIALSGIMQESMVRTEGWNFMDMGRRVERAMQIIKTVTSIATPIVEQPLPKYDKRILLTAMLRSMEVLITYRRQNRGRTDLEIGLELVMIDPSNPRSLIFQFDQLQHHFVSLQPGHTPSRALQEEERVLMKAISSLRLSRITHLVAVQDNDKVELTVLLSQLRQLLADFSNVVNDKYFEHRVDSQQLVTTFEGDQ